MKRQTLRIGTRRSPLALWQAEHVKGLIEKRLQISCSLVGITTQGDRIRTVPLAGVGGKGLFIKEIEEALGRSDIDLAVHSMKDVPAEIPAGLRLSAIPPREDPFDALVFKAPPASLGKLTAGACIGTSSLRRACQIKFHRRDIVTRPVRGNVETRLRKLEEGPFDAIVLAVAGLKRLGLHHCIHEILSPEVCLPAIGQGALAIEIREADAWLHEALQTLHDPHTSAAVEGERGFLAAIGGGCHVPIGCFGKVLEGTLELTGLVASLSGFQCVRRSKSGPVAEAASLGRRLGEEVLAAGGAEILDEIEKTLGALG